MNRRLDDIIESMAGRYADLCGLSDWGHLNSLDNLDKANAALDRREALIREVETLKSEAETLAGADALKTHPRFEELQACLNQINEYDVLFIQKINDRMREIQSQLRNQAMLRVRALPCYARQKMAFAR